MYTRIGYPVAPAVAALVAFPIGCCAGYLLGHSLGYISIPSAWLTAASWLLLGLGTAWLSDRRLSAFLAGISFTLGLAFFALDITIPLMSLILLLVAWILLAAIGGGVSFAIHAVIRLTCIEFVAQDNTRCPRCAYPILAPSPSNRCPECGTFVSEVLRQQERRARVIESLNRRSPYVLAVMVAAGLGPTVILVIWTLRHNERFAQYVREVGGPEMYGSMFGTGQTGQLVTGWRASGTLLPVPDDASKLLFVAYAPRVIGAQPRMQIRLVWGPPPTWPGVFVSGLPPILCNLSPDQADALMQHGVPETLYDAMLDASKSAGWPLVLPPPGPGGSITLSRQGPAPVVVIPAERHFPSSTIAPDK